MVTPSSTAVDVTEGREYVFRTCFTDAQQGEVAARFVKETLKKDRAAILYAAQDNYSSGLADTFSSAFTALGGTITVEKGYQKGETKFTTYLEAIKASHADVIFAPVYYNDMAQIGPQAVQAGIATSAFVGGDGWDSDDLLETAGAELEGSFYTNAYAPDVPWPNSAAFVKAFRAKYGHVPGALAAQGYDGAKLLAEAIARAPRVTPEAIKVALSETKDFAGATGTLTIDAHHDANKPVCIVQIKDKAFHFFAELTAVGAAPRKTVPAARQPTTATRRPVRSERLLGSTRHRARAGGDDRARRARLHHGLRRAQAHQLRPQRGLHDGRICRPVRDHGAHRGGSTSRHRLSAPSARCSRWPRRRSSA